MTSWGVITVGFQDEQPRVAPDTNLPPELATDAGLHEYGWVEEDDIWYGLSYGRHQHVRFEAFCEELHSPWFNGIEVVTVTEANNTGERATVRVFEPSQNHSEKREDGFYKTDVFDGDIFEASDIDHLKMQVEQACGLRPVLRPRETEVPPDAVVTLSGSEVTDGR